MPLRILVLTPGLPGGMERVFEHLNSALEQERADFCLHFFTTHGPLWKSLLLFLPRLFYFTILVTFKKFDVCHINLAWGGSTYRKIAYGMLCRWLSLPYVIHLHGSRFREYFLGSSAAHQKRIEKFFQGADKVIVLGTPWRDFIHEKLCVPLDDVVILPNAVQGPHHFPLYKEHAKKHILFLGQLGERKGTKDLVNALSNPKLKHLSWSATLAGDGQVAKYKKDVQAKELNERITIPGWVGPDDVEKLLSQSDILVLPSYAENLPVSMLEGMAYGLCPVVTPVGAVTDVIKDGENGVLVPVGDVDTLSERLVDLLQDTEKCDRLAHNARQTFEKNFNIQSYQAELSIIYNNISR